MNSPAKTISSVIAIAATALTIISGVITIYVFFSGQAFFVWTKASTTTTPGTQQPTSPNSGFSVPYGWGAWIIWIIFGFLCAWWLISWVTEYYDADGCFSGCWIWSGLWIVATLVEFGSRFPLGLFISNSVASTLLSIVVLGLVGIFYTAWLVDN